MQTNAICRHKFEQRRHRLEQAFGSKKKMKILKNDNWTGPRCEMHMSLQNFILIMNHSPKFDVDLWTCLRLISFLDVFDRPFIFCLARLEQQVLPFSLCNSFSFATTRLSLSLSLSLFFGFERVGQRFVWFEPWKRCLSNTCSWRNESVYSIKRQRSCPIERNSKSTNRNCFCWNHIERRRSSRTCKQDQVLILSSKWSPIDSLCRNIP